MLDGEHGTEDAQLVDVRTGAASDVTLIRLFLQIWHFHALNNLLALSFVYLAFSLPFGTWIMRS